MRKYGRVDANQGEIVSALEKIGCTVVSLASVGDGCPDLLVGFKGKNYLLEVKDGGKTPSKKKLTDDQVKFFAKWRGQVSKVESIFEALQEIGITAK